MKLSLQQIRTPITRADAFKSIVTFLNSLGFPAESWQEGSTQRGIIETGALIWSDCATLVSNVSNFLYNNTAEGGALDAFSESHYSNARLAAIQTQGWIQVIDTTGAPSPTTLQIGEMIVADAEGHQFSNLSVFTINSSSPSIIDGADTYKYEYALFGSVGADNEYNISDNNTLTLVTDFAGFTVANPRPLSDANHPKYQDVKDGYASDTWITQYGAAQESDSGLRKRNIGKWNRLSNNTTYAGMEGLVRSAHPLITRVKIYDGYVYGNQPGTFKVYIASEDGVILSGTDPFIAATAMVQQHRPLTSNIINGILISNPVYQVSTKSISVFGGVYVRSGYNNALTRSRINAALEDALNVTPIGGDEFPQPGTVDYSRLMRAILSVDGVLATAISFNGFGIGSGVPLNYDEIPILGSTTYNLIVQPGS